MQCCTTCTLSRARLITANAGHQISVLRGVARSGKDSVTLTPVTQSCHQLISQLEIRRGHRRRRVGWASSLLLVVSSPRSLVSSHGRIFASSPSPRRLADAVSRAADALLARHDSMGDARRGRAPDPDYAFPEVKWYSLRRLFQDRDTWDGD
jgi:hypothetical protein